MYNSELVAFVYMVVAKLYCYYTTLRLVICFILFLNIRPLQVVNFYRIAQADERLEMISVDSQYQELLNKNTPIANVKNQVSTIVPDEIT